MRDSTLLKLSLILSLLGLALLLVLTEFVEPESATIAEAKASVGKHVYIEGEVDSAAYKDSVTFFSISDESGEVPVVVFDKMERFISTGDLIGITGEVSLYKGQEEIIASEIVCLRCGG